MHVEPLAIPEVKLLTPRKIGDARGFFSEVYNLRTLADAAGITEMFVQDNHAYSAEKGVVRGLHFQLEPMAQGKLVRVTRGSIFDVAVDLRSGSPTFGKHVAAEISARNWTQIWVPKGFAHGYCTLEPDTEVLYKTTALYAPEFDRGLAWDDDALAISWPVEAGAAILSARDKAQPKLAELPVCFEYRHP